MSGHEYLQALSIARALQAIALARKKGNRFSLMREPQIVIGIWNKPGERPRASRAGPQGPR